MQIPSFNRIHPLLEKIFRSKKSQLSIYPNIQETLNFGLIYSKSQKDLLLSATQFFKNNPNMNRIVFFTADQIDVQKETVKGMIFLNDEFHSIETKIPSFIYNMAIHTKPSNIQVMRHLRVLENVKVINPINRFYLSVLFDMLSSFSGSEAFLLPYSLSNKDILLDFIQKYDSILMLPEKNTKFNKCIIIKKGKKLDNYSVTIGINVQEYTKDNLFGSIKRIIGNQQYVIMKAPEMLNFQDTPLEVRGYVQKDGSGFWSITDIIAKSEFFSKGSIYHNTSSNLKNVLVGIYEGDIVTLEHRLHEISLNICTFINHFITNIGAITLDYVVGIDGNPYLINIGGWEQKQFLYSLRELGSWKSYIEKTIDYLCSQEVMDLKGVKNALG